MGGAYQGAGVGAVDTEQGDWGLGGGRACRGGVGPHGSDWGARSCRTGSASCKTTGQHGLREERVFCGIERCLSSLHLTFNETFGAEVDVGLCLQVT